MDEIDLMESIAASRRRQASRSVRPFEITLMQYHLILLARRRGSLSPSQAAQELECDRPGMTLLARKCVRSGWLSRRRSPADRRSSRLELTGEGEELLDKIEATQAVSPTSLGDPLEVLDPGERASFREMLSRVHARAMEHRGQHSS